MTASPARTFPLAHKTARVVDGRGMAALLVVALAPMQVLLMNKSFTAGDMGFPAKAIGG